MLTYSREGNRIRGGVCPRSLPDGTKSILTGIIKKSHDWVLSVVGDWTLDYIGRSQE